MKDERWEEKFLGIINEFLFRADVDGLGFIRWGIGFRFEVRRGGGGRGGVEGLGGGFGGGVGIEEVVGG